MRAQALTAQRLSPQTLESSFAEGLTASRACGLRGGSDSRLCVHLGCNCGATRSECGGTRAMEAAAVPCRHLRSVPADACKKQPERPKWYCASTANALQPGFKKKACDAPYLASSCELAHVRCDRLRLECRCGAFRSWTGVGMLRRLRKVSCKGTRPCACASAAIATQPGPNEVGMQLRLKRICHSGHMRRDRGSSEPCCHCGANSPDEVGMQLRLMHVSSKGMRPCLNNARWHGSNSGASHASEVGAER